MNTINNPVVKATAWGTGLGAVGGASLSVMGGLGVAVTGTALAFPPVAAGAMLGGLMGLAYGVGKRQG